MYSEFVLPNWNFYAVERKSHEQGLIIKKYVTMHIKYFLKFKMALCSGILVKKLF